MLRVHTSAALCWHMQWGAHAHRASRVRARSFHLALLLGELSTCIYIPRMHTTHVTAAAAAAAAAALGACVRNVKFNIVRPPCVVCTVFVQMYVLCVAYTVLVLIPYHARVARTLCVHLFNSPSACWPRAQPSALYPWIYCESGGAEAPGGLVGGLVLFGSVCVHALSLSLVVACCRLGWG